MACDQALCQPSTLRIPQQCPVCDGPLTARPMTTEMFEPGPDTAAGVKSFELVELVGTSYECDLCKTSVIAGGLRRIEEAAA